MADIFDTVGHIGDAFGSWADKVSQFNLGQIALPMGGRVGFFIKFFIYLGIGVIGFIIFYKLFIEYKIRIGLRFKTGGSIVDIKEDRAKEFTDKQGKTKLVLFRYKKLHPPPKPSLSYKYKKGKSDYYEFVVDDNDNLHPCEIASGLTHYDDEGGFRETYLTRPIPQERLAWAIMERKAQEEKIRKKSWFQQNKEFIITVGMFAMMVLVTYFMFDYLKKGSYAIAQQLGQIAQNCMRG